MVEELNELEKIGLAFLSGLIAGQSLEEANEEADKEETKCDKVIVGELDGEKAEKFIKMIKELGGK